MKAINIFLSLKGTWNFKRALLPRNPTVLWGTLEGNASFRTTHEYTLHYKEEAVLTRSSGETWRAFKEYFFVYSQDTDSLSKYFSESGQIGNLFYRLTSTEENCAANGMVASGNHLCINDLYIAEYKFDFQKDATDFSRFELKYDVTGPQKDYESWTVFERAASPTAPGNRC